ncbi:hypothetical protein [Sphingosinithalassobacter sp. LHW66-3]|uniref:hypothetical protein n=1 Tax=Sphingosinithalassobacter sp. LHW66-3 TaxID=3424718 RepID=UPI003D6A9A30
MLVLTLLALLGQDAIAAANEQDLRCVAAMAAASETVSDEVKSGMAVGIMYFLGRIEGRSPDFHVEAGLVRRFSESAWAEQIEADLERCGAQIRDKGIALTAIGNRLTEQGF